MGLAIAIAKKHPQSLTTEYKGVVFTLIKCGLSHHLKASLMLQPGSSPGIKKQLSE